MLARRWSTFAGNPAATSPGSPCWSTVGSPSSRYRRCPLSGHALAPWRAASDRPKSSAATNVTALTPALPASGIINRRNGGNMASEQMQQLASLFGSGRERFSRNNVGLQDVRDICEGLHAASAEPEGVTYAEVNAGGVPALWCIPAECDANSVLLHSHAGDPDGPRAHRVGHADRRRKAS